MKKLITENKLIISTIIIGCMVVGGCSSRKEPQKTNNLKKLKLVKDLTIKANTQKALIGNFSSLAVGNLGDIFTADEKLQKINVFSQDGDYLRSLGRKGKGPGEFTHLNNRICIRSDTLYAMQIQTRRIDLFNIKSHKVIRSIKIPKIKVNNSPIGQPRNLFPLSNGNILMSFNRPYFQPPKVNSKPHFITISELSPSGKFLRKNIVQFPESYPSGQTIMSITSKRMMVWTNLSFYPEYKIAVSPEGHLFSGMSDSLLIRQYNGQGQSINKLQASFRPVEFTYASFDSVAQKKGHDFKKAIKNVGLPHYWPVFQHFIIDNKGRCWVELLKPGKSQQKWLVFNRSGQPKWTFSLSGAVQLYNVKDRKAYGISRPDNHLASIVRYDINGF